MWRLENGCTANTTFLFEEKKPVEEETATRPSFDIKKGDVRADIVPAASPSLPTAANEDLSVVLEAMKQFALIMMWNSGILWRHEDVLGGFLEGKVDFALTEPSYNVSPECNMAILSKMSLFMKT